MRPQNCLRILSVGILALSLSGCAATQAAIHIGKANKAVERAKEKGAPEYAVYEYTMAENYLKKSREEAGYSDFRDSVDLSNGAAEWADKAVIVIEKEGRGLDPDALPGKTRTLTEEDRAVPAAPSALPPEDPDLPEDLEPTPDEAPTSSEPVEGELDPPSDELPLQLPPPAPPEPEPIKEAEKAEANEPIELNKPIVNPEGP